MRLYKTVVREIPGKLKKIMVMNVIAAAAAVFFIDIITSATQNATEEGKGEGLALMFIVAILLIHITHNYTLVNASKEAEQLIHKLRTRLFNLVRRTDMVTVDKIGFARLQGVVTQDTQVLAHILPLLVIGLQQGLMLVFMAVFLASESMLAFVLSFGLSGIAVAVRFARGRALKAFLRSADGAKNKVFNGLTDLLAGFKEVRMSRSRAEGLVDSLSDASEARVNNATLMKKWGQNFAAIEVMLYALIGLIVFVVPFFSTDFYEVVLTVTIAVLFISGPVSTVSFVTPMVNQAELSLENLENMEEHLKTLVGEQQTTSPVKLEADIETLELRNVELAYRNDEGEALFSCGPINASFEAGKITFITGGNGSGKSTLLRLLTGLIPLDSGNLGQNK
jgi:putative ATP-binding cassette transporter